jgi:hypothetical protein
MPEAAQLAPVSRNLFACPDLSNMIYHILSIFPGMIDSLPAGRFEGLYVLFA